MLPMGLGYVEGVTHDYERHGTTTLFAALDVAQRRRCIAQLQAAPSSSGVSVPSCAQSGCQRCAGRSGCAPDRRQLRHAQARRRCKAWSSGISALPHALHRRPTAPGSTRSSAGSALITRASNPSRFVCNSVKRTASQRIDHFVGHVQQQLPNRFVWTATADSILEKLASTLFTYQWDRTLGAGRLS